MKLTKTISILFIVFSQAITAQNWLWSKQFVPATQQAGMGGKIGPDGYLYCGGGFQNSLTLNNGNNLTGSNYSDGFIAKFDTAGICQWTTKVLPVSGCGCGSIGNGMGPVGFDSQGNIIVTGSYCGCGANFGNGITSNQFGYTLFIAKYNPLGQCLWVKTKPESYGGGGGFNALTMDGNDNIYISLANAATNTQLSGLTFATQNNYLVKLDGNGNGVWNYLTSNGASGYGILNLECKSNKLYGACWFRYPAQFGPVNYVSQGSDDLALISMDTAGTILHVSPVQGTGTEEVIGLAVGNNASVYFIGKTDNDSVTIAGNYLNTNNSHSKWFIIRYDTLLNLTNYKNIATNQNAGALDLEIDKFNNLYMSTMQGGTTTYDGIASTGTSNKIVKMDANMTAQWVTGSGFDLELDSAGSVYTFQGISAATNFGPFLQTPSNGVYAVILSKIGQPGLGVVNKMSSGNNSLIVYPNPANTGIIQLKTNTNIKSTNGIQVKLYDVLGKLVEDLSYIKIDTNTLQVDLSSYANGSYIIKAVIDGVNYTAKVER